MSYLNEKLLGIHARYHAQRAAQVDEEGATAVEYGIMVALIAAVIVVIVGTLGGQVQTAFQTVSNALANAVAE